jgi:5-methyltetrahydrofolate--homocysteine methyltransferase
MFEAVSDDAPDAVGVNCTVDAERMRRPVEALVEAFGPSSAFALPIIAQPQAKISDKCASGRSSEPPERFATFAARLVDAGVDVIGGCCGIGPAAITALDGLLNRTKNEAARSGEKIANERAPT